MNQDSEYVSLPPTANGPVPAIHSTDLSDSYNGVTSEKYGHCDSVLKHINQVLMEDDMEDEACMVEDSTLHAAEEYYYKILNEKYPLSPNPGMPCEEKPSCSSSCGSSSADANNPVESAVVGLPCTHCTYVDHAFRTTSPSSSYRSFLSHSIADLVSAPSDGQSSCQFHVDSKNIIPSETGVTFNFEEIRFASPMAKENPWPMKATLQKEEGDCPDSLPRTRKIPHRDESAFDEGRCNKHLAVDVEEYALYEIFDKVLSFGEPALHTFEGYLPTKASVKWQQYKQAKGCNDQITFTKKGFSKRKAVNMRKLLIQCMRSVASGNDQMTATKLLTQIRLRSSPQGDESERLAHYFANGLEARLTNSKIPQYRPFSMKGIVESKIWEAHKLYISAFPFMGISYFVATQMIMELARKASSLHIIHFGIIYGSLCPLLIRSLSKRPGGPPKLRITAIDLPQIDFRFDTRIKKTGRRLATYCEKFKVPFEYNGFDKKWETVCVEDLKIQEEEVLVVICLNQSKDLLDDTIVDYSQRDAFLNLTRKINPDIFIHGIVNGTFNSPFFISRFREALFHFSALFDMVDAIVPRDNHDRIVLERDIWGQEILNVIACEGLNRVERFETYREWEIRTLRAAFRQLPLNQEILKEVRAKIKSLYHKDFFVDKADKWMIHGWRGRAFFAISSWKPA